MRNRRNKCDTCRWLNYDFFGKHYEHHAWNFCGLHGREHIDTSIGINLGERGECGYKRKLEAVQLELFKV